MNLFASLLMPSLLPNAAAALAPAANTAQHGQQSAGAFGQFQALLAMMNPDSAANASEGGDTPPLSMFGVTPPKVSGSQPEAALENLLNPSTLDGATAGASDQNPTSLLVDPIFAQFAAPLVIAQKQASAPTSPEPKADAALTVNVQLGLRRTISPTQTHADTAPPPSQSPNNPAVTGAPQPKSNAPQTPATGKPSAAPKRSSTSEHITEAKPGLPEGRSKPNATEAVSPSPVAANTANHSQSAPPQAQPGSAEPAPPPAGQPIAAAPASPLPAVLEIQQVNAAVVAAPQAGVPLDALAVHIARKFEAGSNQFEIRLHPAELGQLDISLTVADDGHVQAVLRADRPETLDMLQKDARALEQQLRQAGLEVGSNALSFSLSSGNGQRHAPFSGWPGFADAQGAAGAAKEEAAAKYIAVRVRDGVDIRV